MQKRPLKIVIAAGGTGGHMFPAQALASELKEIDKANQILFVGAGLETNKYFRKDLFSYFQVDSATIFRKGLMGFLKPVFVLFKGVIQAYKVLSLHNPDLVVGFGSFHSFPVMCAALIKRTPLVIFESNALPGRVNRLFSRFAKLSAVQFSKAADYLKGKWTEVAVPFWNRNDSMAKSKQDALAHFALYPQKRTFLVFGGSQGAQAVSLAFSSSLEQLKEYHESIQVIHMTGNDQDTEQMKQFYDSLGVSSCVKSFEDKMHHAWLAADIVVCRSGAATLAEMLTFEVPGILIPFPKASEDHQKINAQFVEEVVGGAHYFSEDSLDVKQISSLLDDLLHPESLKWQNMKESIREFKRGNQKQSLSEVLYQIVFSTHTGS